MANIGVEKWKKMRMSKRWFVGIVMGMLSLCGVHAAAFRQLNIADGLSSRQVYQVSRDSAGFVWLFTHVGVDRYDGNEFRHYRLDEPLEAKDHLLSSTRMICDPEGRIWLALKNGHVFAYEAATDRFVRRIRLADFQLADARIHDFYFDAGGQLWLCLSAGLYRYDPSADRLIPQAGTPGLSFDRIRQIDPVRYVASTSTGLHLLTRQTGSDVILSRTLPLPPGARVESFYLRGDTLYIGTFAHRLYRYDIPSGELYFLPSPVPPVPVRAMAAVGDELWVATDGSGIYCLDPVTARLLRRYGADADDPGSLAGNTVSDLAVDARGRVWISTSTHGLSLFDPDAPAIHWTRHAQGNPRSLASDHVNVMVEDTDGDLWYGTNNGVSLYRTATGEWTHFLEDQGREADGASVILALCEDSLRRVWAGGYGIGLYCLDKRTGRAEKMQADTASYIYTLFADRESVWWGGIEGRLTRYQPAHRTFTYYPADCIGDIRRGSEGRVWLAGCEGVASCDPDGGTLRWRKEFGGITLRYPVRCLWPASDGVVWLATDGDGLIGWRTADDSVRVYTEANGLSSNSISAVVEDETGNIWFTTEQNLYKIDKASGRVLDRTAWVGLDWGCFNPHACLRLRDGRLAFGTAEGAVAFPPWREEETRRAPVRLLWTDFKLLYQSVEAGGEGSLLEQAIDRTSTLHLPYGQNSFSLAFSSLCFDRPQSIRYRYRLEGFDKTIRWADGRRRVEYMNLPPGSYRFRLEAIDTDTGRQSGERTLAIRIGPPFWASWPAWLLYILATVVVVALFWQYGRQQIAEHNAREKIRFFIRMAHDIRTPVTLIKAPLSELEAEESLSAPARKSVSVALKSVDKLFGMVTQLLDFQQIDSRAQALTVAPHDLEAYLQEKLMPFRVAARQKGVEVTTEIAAGFPTVWFDRAKMDGILDNLLSNAIKYTSTGSVTVTAGWKGKEWTLAVRDTGIGIPDGEQGRLFKPFFRAKNAIASEETGTGIGLLLCRELVRLHDGRLRFFSAEGEGSTFVLTFPSLRKNWTRAVAESAVGLAPDERHSSPEKERATVILAEDNDELRAYLAESLAQTYRVIALPGGSQVEEMAQEMNPDLIISDVLMPDVRGDELCHRLKSSIKTSHIPFILLSALSEKENVIRGLESGADDYIIKPFDFSVLRARIRNILQRREHTRKTLLQSGPEAETDGYTGELDREFLAKAVAIIEEEMENPEFAVNDFCSRLAMSRTSVYNKLKSLTNQAPNDFIRIIRLNRAKELLKTKRYSIAEVSTRVGFADPKYFSTSFKKEFGIPPSQYGRG